MRRATFRLVLLLLLTVAAYAWLSDAGESNASLAQIALPSIGVPSSSDPGVQAGDRATSTEDSSAGKPSSNPFVVRSWDPPKPQAISAPSVPPPPQAPPLPFRFVGRVSESDADTAFMLQFGERILVVRVGDDIDDIYRIDSYRNGRLEFVYRPLQIRQSLFVGTDS